VIDDVLDVIPISKAGELCSAFTSVLMTCPRLGVEDFADRMCGKWHLSQPSRKNLTGFVKRQIYVCIATQ
jgi:hypothetical protein